MLLHSGGAGESVDATCSVSSEQSVVSLLPPARAPGVLDDPVGHLLVEQRVLVLPKANDQHSMVNAWKKVTREHFGQFITIRAAEELPRVGYTAFVELHSVCVQADRDWAILEEPLKGKSKKRSLLVEYLGHLGLIL